jgi:hypothetical protein
MNNPGLLIFIRQQLVLQLPGGPTSLRLSKYQCGKNKQIYHRMIAQECCSKLNSSEMLA